MTQDRLEKILRAKIANYKSELEASRQFAIKWLDDHPDAKTVAQEVFDKMPRSGMSYQELEKLIDIANLECTDSHLPHENGQCKVTCSVDGISGYFQCMLDAKHDGMHHFHTEGLRK